jgi:hypothetical protein
MLQLSLVEDGLFQRILNSFVEIGREDTQFHFGSGGCTLSRYRTRKAIIDEADILSHTILVDYAKRPCVSLVIDAGTITRRHFQAEAYRREAPIGLGLSPIGNKMKLRVHFEIQSSKMRHIGTQYGFSLLPSSTLSQKYRMCHFIHQITGYE